MRGRLNSKADFLAELQRLFEKTHIDDTDDIIYDFNEHFLSAKCRGRNEQDIINGLGTPKSIVKMYRTEFLIEKAENKHSLINIILASTAAIGFSLLNFVLLAAPLMLLLILFFSFAVTGIGMILIGILAVLMQIAELILPHLISLPVAIPFFLFVGTSTFCLGSLLVIGCIKGSEYFYMYTIMLLKQNLRMIRKQVHDE